MPRLPNDPHRDVAGWADDDVNLDIAELLSLPPPPVDEFFADPMVRLRVGTIVTRAMNEPTHRRRRAKPR